MHKIDVILLVIGCILLLISGIVLIQMYPMKQELKELQTYEHQLETEIEGMTQE